MTHGDHTPAYHGVLIATSPVVRSLLDEARRKRYSHGVLGVRAQPRWDGPDTFTHDDVPVRVVPCVSALAAARRCSTATRPVGSFSSPTGTTLTWVQGSSPTSSGTGSGHLILGRPSQPGSQRPVLTPAWAPAQRSAISRPASSPSPRSMAGPRRPAVYSPGTTRSAPSRSITCTWVSAGV
jgi:hypothetical protein